MSSGSSNSNAGKKPAGGPTIRTLADLNRRPAAASPGSDSDEPQEFYTGGEKSGMLVQDPTQSQRNDLNSFFEQARQMGMLQTPFEPEESSSSGSFTGTGRLVTGETVQPVAPQQPPAAVIRYIHLWSNGFSVDDGPLRGFEDPANAPFLQSVLKSECPKELEPPPGDSSTVVHVNVLKHNEDYKEPDRPAVRAFQGVGRTLGDVAPATEPTAVPAPAAAASRPASFSVDESLPYTSIQLRLADGTRMVARFNMHHSVGDIRAFIDASRPGAARTYRLQTGFPPKQLADPEATVEQAGLANSVIIQHL